MGRKDSTECFSVSPASTICDMKTMKTSHALASWASVAAVVAVVSFAPQTVLTAPTTSDNSFYTKGLDDWYAGQYGSYGSACPDIPPSWWTSCMYYLWRGRCNSWYMYQYSKFPGSYCAATCGRCPVYEPPKEIIIITITNIRFTIVLNDMRPADFDSAAQLKFRRAIGNVADVNEALVTIIRVQPVGSNSIAITVQVSFRSDMPGVDEKIARFQNVVADLPGAGAGGTGRRLLQTQPSLLGALQSAGFTVAAEQPGLNVEKKEAGVTVPVTQDESAESVAGNDEKLGAQIQAVAAAGEELKTPEDLGLTMGETKTVAVPEEAQQKARTALTASKRTAESNLAQAPAEADFAADGQDEDTLSDGISLEEIINAKFGGSADISAKLKGANINEDEKFYKNNIDTGDQEKVAEIKKNNVDKKEKEENANGENNNQEITEKIDLLGKTQNENKNKDDKKKNQKAEKESDRVGSDAKKKEENEGENTGSKPSSDESTSTGADDSEPALDDTTMGTEASANTNSIISTLQESGFMFGGGP